MTLEELFDAVKDGKPLEYTPNDQVWGPVDRRFEHCSFAWVIRNPDKFRLAPLKWALEKRAQELGAVIQKMSASHNWEAINHSVFLDGCRYRIHPDHGQFFDDDGELKVTLPPIKRPTRLRERVAHLHGARIEQDYSCSDEWLPAPNPINWDDPGFLRIHLLQNHLFDENGMPKP